jgi:hypothetical protein
MYYGLVKPLPIMLGMLSESLLGGKLGEAPNIVAMVKPFHVI